MSHENYPDVTEDDRWHMLRLSIPTPRQVAAVARGEPITTEPGRELIVGTGWVNNPNEVAAVTTAWEARGMPSRFEDAAPRLMLAGDDDSPVFFWDAEERVLGRRLDTWNQRQVGSCVGFGSTREAQDLLLWEIASGEPEEWPGFELAPEVTYGGSRVEIGGGRIRGDGSVGAWAAEFLMRFGVVIRGVYGAMNLSQYSESLCRQLGSKGLPTDLEAVAKVHPVRAAAMVKTKEEVWAAVGGGKPVFVCSDRGFSTRMDADGFCSPSGEWNHCMGVRGRFVHPRRGRSNVIGNSWADYMGVGVREVDYIDSNGRPAKFKLPPGCFCTTWDTVGGMAGQGDSFSLAGLTGWNKTSPVDYTP